MPALCGEPAKLRRVDEANYAGFMSTGSSHKGSTIKSHAFPETDGAAFCPIRIRGRQGAPR